MDHTLEEKFILKREAFLNWLSRNGAEILSPVDENELVRFICTSRISSVWRSKNRGLTFNGASAAAWHAFTHAKPWRAVPKPSRRGLRPKIRALLDRDGTLCFFCRQELGEDITVEHLLCATFGGVDHMANLALAHGTCNKSAGNLSLAEKINIHVKGRIKNGR